MSRITLTETTASGVLLNTYVVTPIEATAASEGGRQDDHQAHSPSHTNARIDVISPEITTTHEPASETPKVSSSGLSISSLQDSVLAPFLPVGYPDSVSPDYTPYQRKSLSSQTLMSFYPLSVRQLTCKSQRSRQRTPLTYPPLVYDSLQAALSTIASLLASRAVLTTLGVGSADATTALAINLSILQTTISNISSILFAHRFATSIAQDVKFYRFFADIVNDTAFVLDVLSPSLPQYARIPALCVASACRSICGVAGGASKAVLSSHFATRDNIGELNAKDGSQETVVNLIGMWVGGFVVGRIEGTAATWGWLLFLLAGHLWANFMAVASIRLRTLNQRRASMVVDRVMQGTTCDVNVVGKEEKLFGRRDQLMSHSRVVGTWAFGGIDGLLRSIRWRRQASGRAYSGDVKTLRHLLEIFGNEEYLLWWDRESRRCTIVSKAKDASANVGCDIHLKAMCHAWILASGVEPPMSEKASEVVSEVEALRRSLQTIEKTWQDCLARVRRGGWDLEGSNLETEATSRLQASID
jgi:hypothetical protein